LSHATTPELLSLFCGAGGLDAGFRDAGFRTVLALDNSDDAVNTFNLNDESQVAQVANLATLAPKEFLELIPKTANPVGLIGGPPCQGFSRGNVYADESDPRNLLPFRYADLLNAANCKYGLHFFVFENVVGLSGPKHANRFKRICTRLKGAGFNLFQGELNASDFSVAQRRRRLFLVGLNRDLYPNFEFEFPKSAGASKTVADVLKGLPSPRFFERELKPESIPFHRNHWTMKPKSAKFKSGEASDGRSFRRIKWNEVSPTVAYGHREIHVHPDGGRRLSVLEAMLLQGFSDKYTLTGSLSAQITQVSNAVPPPVAKAIAKAVKSILGFQSDGRQNRQTLVAGVA
jgi:DNA (cytosine-5)-methyltransferase 1